MSDRALPPDPFTFALVGAGKVGTTVATLLRDAGHRPVGVASRTASSARRAAETLGAATFDLSDPPAANVYLLGVPDDALIGTATELVGRIEPDAVIVHFAGARGIAGVASPRRDRVAALHPVQAFADPRSAAERLPGSAWGVTCSAGLEPWCELVVERDLKGRPVAVAEGDRALWHAAAVMASNVLAAVMVAGSGVLARIGITDPGKVLEPLITGTLANVVAAGAGADSITGPVVRTEVGTVTRHLAAMTEHAPELRSAYVHATRTIVAVARSFGRIDAAVERAFLDELGIS